MVGNIEYDKELFAIVLFDWTLACSLDKEMKDCSVGRERVQLSKWRDELSHQLQLQCR
jgi:hypothetical protein